VQTLAGEVAAARSALDIGGGSGHYATALFEANPQLQVTLVDRADVIATIRPKFADAVETGRLILTVGDACDFDLEPAHDPILICDLLHYFGLPDKRRILSNASKALAPAAPWW
jgi:ubiquinone/menaquinone biosynthesis C-methylase UbiE